MRSPRPLLALSAASAVGIGALLAASAGAPAQTQPAAGPTAQCPMTAATAARIADAVTVPISDSRVTGAVGVLEERLPDRGASRPSESSRSFPSPNPRRDLLVLVNRRPSGVLVGVARSAGRSATATAGPGCGAFASLRATKGRAVRVSFTVDGRDAGTLTARP